jgi:hypothetical protein
MCERNETYTYILRFVVGTLPPLSQYSMDTLTYVRTYDWRGTIAAHTTTLSHYLCAHPARGRTAVNVNLWVSDIPKQCVALHSLNCRVNSARAPQTVLCTYTSQSATYPGVIALYACVRNGYTQHTYTYICARTYTYICGRRKPTYVRMHPYPYVYAYVWQ